MAFDINNDRVSISSDVAVTIIGANTQFKGNITTHTPVYIDGYFEGTIDSDDIIEVSEQGSFKATINCSKLLLKGTGDGKVTCTDLMQFTSTGVFTGDIVTSDLIVIEGSLLDGTCTMRSVRK